MSEARWIFLPVAVFTILFLITAVSDSEINVSENDQQKVHNYLENKEQSHIDEISSVTGVGELYIRSMDSVACWQEEAGFGASNLYCSLKQNITTTEGDNQ